MIVIHDAELEKLIKVSVPLRGNVNNDGWRYL